MTGLGRLGRRISRPVLAVVAGAAVAILPAACGGTGTHPAAAKPEVSGPLHGWTPPQPEALSPLADYQAAVQAAVADHLKVWIETDLVKRWQEGPTWFRAAVSRVAELARQPGVVGIKIADELGYNDGMNSVSKISKFLSAVGPGAARRRARQADPGRHGGAAARLPARPPGARLAGRSLRQPGTSRLPAARAARGRQVPAHARDRRAGPEHLPAARRHLQGVGHYRRCRPDRGLAGGRQARLARPGAPAGAQGARPSGRLPGDVRPRPPPTSRPTSTSPSRTTPMPSTSGPGTSIYEGQEYRLMNPGMQPNALWTSSSGCGRRATCCSRTSARTRSFPGCRATWRDRDRLH